MGNKAFSMLRSVAHGNIGWVCMKGDLKEVDGEVAKMLLLRLEAQDWILRTLPSSIGSESPSRIDKAAEDDDEDFGDGRRGSHQAKGWSGSKFRGLAATVDSDDGD